MNLRSRHDDLGELDRVELESYIIDLEQEVWKLRRRGRATRKAMRGMQRKLGNQNLQASVLHEWSNYKELQKLQEGVITATALYPSPVYQTRVCQECGALNGHLPSCSYYAE
jgi:hypothetical protein